VHGPARRGQRNEERYRQGERDNTNVRFTWPEVNAVDLENMARNAFTRIDDIHNEALHNGGQEPADGIVVEEDEQWNEENVEYLVRESTERVFEGSSQNRLQCCIVLFSLCSLYSVP
jgi:hypothetical protein